MTASMTFQGSISQALAQARQAFGDEQAEAELQAALLKGARLLRADAQARAPRGAKHRVRYRGKERRAGRLAERGIGAALTAPEDQDVPGVGAQMGLLRSWFYGMFFEFGTRKIAPRPFIRPTVARFEEVIQLVGAVFRRRLERLQTKAGGPS